MQNTPLPASLSGVIVERLIRVDEALLYLVSGALAYATDREPYDATGALTVPEVREALGEMLWTYYVEQPVMLPIGTIQMFGLTTPPDKWLECNGDVVPQATYPLLYDAIGTNFGADAGGNFTLPDLRFRTPLGLGELSGNPAYDISIGQHAGQEEVALTINELPAHNHIQQGAGNVPLWTNAGTGANPRMANTVTTNSTTPNVTTTTGDGNAFPLIQPGIGLLFCIYAGE